MSAKPTLRTVSLETDSEITNTMESTVGVIMMKIDKVSSRFTSVISKCRRSNTRVDWLSCDTESLKKDMPVLQKFGKKYSRKSKYYEGEDSVDSAQVICKRLVAKSLQFADVRSHRAGVSAPLIVTDLEETSSKPDTSNKNTASFSFKPEKEHQEISNEDIEVDDPELVEIEKRRIETRKKEMPQPTALENQKKVENPQEDDLKKLPTDFQKQLNSELFAKMSSRSEMIGDADKNVVKGIVTAQKNEKQQNLNNTISSASAVSSRIISTSQLASELKSAMNQNNTEREDTQENDRKSPVVFRNTGRLSPKALTREDTEAVIDIDPEEAIRKGEAEDRLVKETHRKKREEEDRKKREEEDRKKKAEEEEEEKARIEKLKQMKKKAKKSIFESESDEDIFEASRSSAFSANSKKTVSFQSAAETKIFDEKETVSTLNTSSSTKASSKKQVSSIFDDSSDSGEDSLFRTVIKKTNGDHVASKMSIGGENGNKSSALLLEDSDDDSLFRTLQGVEKNKKLMRVENNVEGEKKEPIASSATLPRRSPGKLDVGAIGGKLNNLLLAGPGNVRGPKDKAIETPDSLNSDVVLPSTETSVIGVLKNRPRGPANRRPPTRSMIMSKSDLTEVTSKVKKTVSQDEMSDPLSF